MVVVTEASCTFRKGERGDGAAVAAVFRAARSQMVYLPVLHTPADEREFFTDRVLGSEDATVTVAVGEEAEQLVGFCAVRNGWIEHLYVAPECQDAGIGTALLERAMAASPGGLSLWVFEQNRRAVALYTRAGFVVLERTDGSGNEEREPDFRMRWDGASRGAAPERSGGPNAPVG